MNAETTVLVQNDIIIAKTNNLTVGTRALITDENIKQADQAFYDQIENNEKTIDEIQDALKTGEVLEEGLLKHTHIDKQ